MTMTMPWTDVEHPPAVQTRPPQEPKRPESKDPVGWRRVAVAVAVVAVALLVGRWSAPDAIEIAVPATAEVWTPTTLPTSTEKERRETEVWTVSLRFLAVWQTPGTVEQRREALAPHTTPDFLDRAAGWSADRRPQGPLTSRPTVSVGASDSQESFVSMHTADGSSFQLHTKHATGYGWRVRHIQG